MTSKAKLIVLAAFDKNDEGGFGAGLRPASGRHGERAVREAKLLAVSHAGVIAWGRETRCTENGPPEVHGDIPDME